MLVLPTRGVRVNDRPDRLPDLLRDELESLISRYGLSEWVDRNDLSAVRGDLVHRILLDSFDGSRPLPPAIQSFE